MIRISLIIFATLSILSCGRGKEDAIDEDKLGIIDADVKSEETNLKEKALYAEAIPGSAEIIERAFENAPPMIPHTTEGFFPIKINNNICFTCHMPDVAESVGATSLPATHFTDLRPKMVEINGVLQFEKEGEIHIEKSDEVVQAYFNCSQCHAPQTNVTIDIENLFTPVFREEFGLKKSSLQARLKEGIEE
jgi:cytochrome c-type protein NapB